uniref:Uncharacterized protein n=1 Tax=Zonotrichia albicollis TaxID=44394 RepID=A0A8D2M7T6_ZONAL
FGIKTFPRLPIPRQSVILLGPRWEGNASTPGFGVISINFLFPGIQMAKGGISWVRIVLGIFQGFSCGLGGFGMCEYRNA